MTYLPGSPSPQVFAEQLPGEIRQLLVQRNEEFERALIQVADGVYTAVGFGVSAVSMVETNEGLVIIDTGIDEQSAAQVIKAFRQISAKPVIAIILTHGHGDHTGGFRSFFLEGRAPEVIVAQGFGSEQREFRDAGLTVQKSRAAMQAGFLLGPDQRINNGIARAYWPQRGGGAFEAGYTIVPTHVVTQPSEFHELGGAGFIINLAPGETKDQLFILLQEQEVLFAGDNFYKSWPNIYAIRGTSYRDIRMWINSLDVMLGHDPHALVGGHTRPIVGKKVVQETLTNYQHALESIFTQTIAGMNRGLTPDELVEIVKLPTHLENLDYLRPYYGHPEWAIRSIFNGYLGWYDGNPSNLFPLSGAEEARRIANLVGGPATLLEQAEMALSEDDPQWSAQLVDYVLKLDARNARARSIKAAALEAMSERVLTTTARNYYKSAALRLRADGPQN